MKIKLLLLLIGSHLVAALPAWSQAVSALPLLTAPATNDFFNVLDVSDITTSTNGRQKKVTVHSMLELFAATNLPYLTTTGSVASAHLKVSSNLVEAVQIWGTTGNANIATPQNNLNLYSTNNFSFISANTLSLTLSATDAAILRPLTVSSALYLYGDSVFNGLIAVPATGNYTGPQKFQNMEGVQHAHGAGLGAITLSSLTNRHSYTATGNRTVTIGGTLPAAPAVKVIEIEMLQDATGGRTNVFTVAPYNGYPEINTNANATTLIQLRTANAGTSWFASSSYGAASGASEAYVTAQIAALGIRSEMIPVTWMTDGGNPPAVSSLYTLGLTTVRVRQFAGTGTNTLRFNWQKPRDAIDGAAAADFQLKWRFVAIATASTGVGASLGFQLAGVGRTSLDTVSASVGTYTLSATTGLNEVAGDLIYGDWTEMTFVEGVDGWVNFSLAYDNAYSTDFALALPWIEFAYAVNPRARTYASP